MASTLQFQLDPKIEGIWTHACYDRPPVIDAADNVDNDFDERATNKEGYAAYGFVEPRQVYILIRAKTAGYEEQVIGPIQMPHDALIPVTLVPLGESGPLDTYDAGGARLAYGFKDHTGTPWFLAGYSVHLLPNLIDRGEDPGPIIAEAQGYRANTLIPICTHRSQWKKDNGYLFDPLADEARFQRVLESMCEVTAAARIRLAPAILADVQDLDTARQQRIVDLATEVFARYELVLPRTGNECNANGYDPSRLNMSKVHHLLWSHGSYGENNPPLHTGARWAEWEGRRDYRNGYHKAMDDAGAGILELNNGYAGAQGQIGPFHCPVVGIEMPYFADSDPDHVGDRRWTDPRAALQLGLNLGANAAGGGAGTSLGLECKPNGPLAAECMREQFRGMWAGFLR